MILSLYDFTGIMVQPWLNAGHRAVIVDNQHTGSVVTPGPWKLNLDLYCEASYTKLYHYFRVPANRPRLITGFPPCTDLAVSGAAHFKKKGRVNPQFQQEATEHAVRIAKLADDLRVPYMIENPVSVLSSLWRAPDYRFHPFEYGGYLPVHDIHPDYPEIIPPRDAYTKKTCLWTSDSFVMPPKKEVQVPKQEQGWSPMQSKLGGKSKRTKNIRSATPRGFALAVFEANSGP